MGLDPGSLITWPNPAVLEWCEKARLLACMNLEWFGGSVPEEQSAAYVTEMLRLTETCFELPLELFPDD